MEVTFADKTLDDLETNLHCKSRFDKSVVRAYRKLLQYVRDASDERDLRAWPGKHFEKLLGNRAHQHSMKIDYQWRLVFEIEPSSPKNIIRVLSIENYHKG